GCEVLDQGKRAVVELAYVAAVLIVQRPELRSLLFGQGEIGGDQLGPCRVDIGPSGLDFPGLLLCPSGSYPSEHESGGDHDGTHKCSGSFAPVKEWQVKSRR